MFARKTLLIRVLCTMAATVSSGLAGLVYDNGPPDYNDAPSNYHGSEMTHWIEADNFVLKQPARLDSLTFWDFEITSYFASSVVWQIYSDNGNGQPGELLFTGTSRNITRSGTGLIIAGGFTEYITSFDIGPLSLPRGTYWVALHNGDLNNGVGGTYQQWNVYWEATASTTGPASQHKTAPYDGPWFTNAYPKLPSDLAFQLSGAAAPPALDVHIQGNDTHLRFVTNVGTTYRIDYKDSVASSAWTAVPGADRIAGTGDVIELTDSNALTNAHRYYRVSPVYDGPGAPVISNFGLGEGAPQISFTTTTGLFYRVEYKNEMSDLNWSAVSGAESIVGSGNVMQINDSDPNLPAHPRRFYRVTLQ